MHRIDGEDSELGFFRAGDPQNDVQGSVVTAEWLNDVQESIVAVISAAGLPLTKGRANDLLDAVHQRIEAFTGTPLENTAALRAYTGTQRKVVAVRGTASYYWFADLYNTTAADDGTTCIVDANGQRWRPRPVAGGIVYDDGSNVQVLKPSDAGATNRKTFTSAVPPANPGDDLHVGDLWIDSDDGNKQYRWNGSAWVSVQDVGADTGRELALVAAANGKTIEQVVLDAAAGAAGSPIAGINVKRWEGTWSTAQRSHVLQITIEKSLGRITIAHKGLNGHSGTASAEIELEVTNGSVSSYSNLDGETVLASAPGGVDFDADSNKWGPNGAVWSETIVGADSQDSFRLDLSGPATDSTVLRLKIRDLSTTDGAAVTFLALGDTPIIANPSPPIEVRFTISDTTSIDALVLTNGPVVPGANSRASTIGVRPNYSSFSTPNDGEAFVHGFDGSNVPADVNGFFIHNGSVETVDRTKPIMTGSVGRGWIVYDTKVQVSYDGKFTVNGSPQRIAFAVKRNGSWFYDNNTTTRVSFTPETTDAVIGTMWCDAADHVQEASVWPYGMALGVVPEADATNRRTFVQTSMPSSELGVGDLWYDSDDGYKQYRYDGSTWVLTRDVGAATGQELYDAMVAAGVSGSVALVAAAQAGGEAYPAANLNVAEWYTSPYSPTTPSAMLRIRINRALSKIEVTFGGFSGHTGPASVDLELEVFGNTFVGYNNVSADSSLTFSASPIDFGTPNRWASNGIRWSESASGTDTDTFEMTTASVPGVATAFRLRIRELNSTNHPASFALGSNLVATDPRLPLFLVFTASDGTDYDVLVMQNAPAHAGATNSKTFTQSSPPANPGDDLHTGDLWNDSDDGNKQYRWNGSAWVSVQDAGAAAGAALSSDLTSLGTTLAAIASNASSGSEIAPLGAVNVVEWYSSPYVPTGDAVLFRIRIDRPSKKVEVQLSLHGAATAGSIDFELEVTNNTFTAYTNVSAETSLTFSGSPIDFNTANRWASNGIRWSESASGADTVDRFEMTLNAVPGASTSFRLRVRSSSGAGGQVHAALGDLLLFAGKPAPWVTYFSPTDGANYDVLVMQNAPAHAGATNSKTFTQSSPPSNPGDDLHTGDLWNDSDDGNKQYRWNGSAWVSVQDAGAAAGAALSTDLTNLGTTLTAIANNASAGSEVAPLGAVNVVEWYASPYVPTGDAVLFRIRMEKTTKKVEVQLSLHGSASAGSVDFELEIFNNTFTAYTNVSAETSLTFSASPIDFNTANRWASNGIRWSESASGADTVDRFEMTMASVPTSATSFRLRMRSNSGTGGQVHAALGDLLLFAGKPAPWVTYFSPTDGANYDVLVMQNAPAHAGATNSKTFTQSSPPSNPGDDLHTGDLWNDSDDGNKQYRWNGSAWVSVQDSNIPVVVGRTNVWMEPVPSVTLPGIETFVGVQESDPDVSVGVGADVIAVHDRGLGTYVEAIRFNGVDALFKGSIISGGGVYFGTTGNKWPYALGEKRFSNLADGDVIAYIDTGTIPDFVFYNTGLDALSSGEAYNLYTSSQTTTSSVVNLKIVTPGSTVGYSKGPTTTDTGTTPKFALSKGADPDADSNAYHLSVDWSVQFTIGSGKTNRAVQVSVEIPIYSKKSGVWTLEGVIYDTVTVGSGYPTTGLKTMTGTAQGTVTLQSAPSDIGADDPTAEGQILLWSDYIADYEWHSLAVSSSLSTELNSVTWNATGATATRSATPGSKRGIVGVIPKNLLA